MTEIRWPQRPVPFWLRFVVTRSGCLEWTGQRDRDGYGRIAQYRDGRRVRVRVHRLIYERLRGPIPSTTLVRHTCDNPPCGRPDHLIGGTPAQNMADKVDRGRHVSGMAVHPERAAKGTANAAAILTEHDVLEIRRLRAEGMPQVALAGRFGVSRSAIKDIDHGRTWGWLA